MQSSKMARSSSVSSGRTTQQAVLASLRVAAGQGAERLKSCPYVKPFGSRFETNLCVPLTRRRASSRSSSTEATQRVNKSRAAVQHEFLSRHSNQGRLAEDQSRATKRQLRQPSSRVLKCTAVERPALTNGESAAFVKGETKAVTSASPEADVIRGELRNPGRRALARLWGPLYSSRPGAYQSTEIFSTQC